MSAPIAVEALVTVLQNPFDQSFCWRLCLWGCGRRRAFPRFPCLLGKRGSGAGRHSRSSTYPQAFLVDLPRRAVGVALMLPFSLYKRSQAPIPAFASVTLA